MGIPIGSTWAQPSWRDDVWGLGTWGAAGSGAPANFGDLTTLFCGYEITIRNANPTKVDTNTLIAIDRPIVVAATNSLDDINTAYAEYLS